MIDRNRLRDLHEVDLPLHVLEQDYAQALFLTELYRETETLVFKGGTFLKHAHGLDRYSEDLDFTAVETDGIQTLLRGAAEGMDRYGLEAEVDNFETKENTVVGRLRYRGPLFDGSDRSRGRIELDVSTRRDVLRETEWRRLFFPYPETRAVTARCLTIEEALAEKLRALGTRTRGRDLYDVWFLLQQGVEVVPELFEEKMAVVDAPPVVEVTISEQEWDRDLSILVEHPPSYRTVRATVEEALSGVGIDIVDETS